MLVESPFCHRREGVLRGQALDIHAHRDTCSHDLAAARVECCTGQAALLLVSDLLDLIHAEVLGSTFPVAVALLRSKGLDDDVRCLVSR